MRNLQYILIALVLSFSSCEKMNTEHTSVEGVVWIHGIPTRVAGVRVYVTSDLSREVASTVSNNDGWFMLHFRASEGIDYTLHTDDPGYWDLTSSNWIDIGEENLIPLYLSRIGCVRFNVKQTSTVDSLLMMDLRAGAEHLVLSPVRDTSFIASLWTSGYPHNILVKKYFQNCLIQERPGFIIPAWDTLDYLIEY